MPRHPRPTVHYTARLRPQRRLSLLLIGLGGTGSCLAESLAALVVALRAQANAPRLDLLFVDDDRVGEENIGRQRFARCEIGEYKSLTLAARLSAAYGLVIQAAPVRYAAGTLDQLLPQRPSPDSLLLIGAVDNPAARACFAQDVERHGFWWLDCGNAATNGHVLIGNGRRPLLHPAIRVVENLPAPHQQDPAIIVPQPPAPLTCATLADAAPQGLTINRAVAALAAEYVRQWLARALSVMATRLALDPPSAVSTPLTHTSLRPYACSVVR